ncbi:hypothetical protein Sste5346_003690 [Sporothrix stenoceras]|uniref:Uncharacterized protein n=1 Tax=Sporothrix stenoceras TaxID=5173 RepID=A0ABR3ZDF4_9PEZI
MASTQETLGDSDSITLIDQQDYQQQTSSSSSSSAKYIVNISDPPSKLDRVVKCSKGHLYTTMWMPGVSFKAMRFGQERVQYCPVGRHWTRVVRVDETQLSTAQLKAAMAHHDKKVV